MKHALALALTALACSACLNERAYFEGGEWAGMEKGVSDPGFSRGALTGDLGPIRGVNDTRAAVTGYSGDEFGGSSSVQVTGAGSDGTGFVILDLFTMDLKTAPAGTYETNSDNMLGITVCSDSHDGSIHFDAMAEDATIVIEDVDVDTREVTIDSTVNDGSLLGGSTTQRASFRLER